jgi:hypothetical protein
MEQLLQSLAEIAKNNLKQYGTIVPVMLWFKNKIMLASPKPLEDFGSAEESKTKNVFVAGALAKVLGADLLVLIWDAAMRTVPHTTKDDLTMDITESPLTYPRSMRTECIVLNAIPFPEGKDSAIFIPYKGGEGEPVEFLPGFPSDDFETRFTEIARNGYNRMGAKDI